MTAIENPYYSPELHGEYELINIGRLDLEDEGSIPECHLAVATFGTLNHTPGPRRAGHDVVLRRPPDLPRAVHR